MDVDRQAADLDLDSFRARLKAAACTESEEKLSDADLRRSDLYQHVRDRLKRIGPEADPEMLVRYYVAAGTPDCPEPSAALVRGAIMLAQGDIERAETAGRAIQAHASRENGKKGGRPSAPPHADVADRYCQARLLDECGRPLMRWWRGCWWRFGARGWREIGREEIVGALVTWLRGEDDLRRFATVNYAASVELNLRAHDLCGLPETVAMPCWFNSASGPEPADNWMAFSSGQCINVWRYASALAASGVPPPASPDHLRRVSPDFFSSDFVGYPWAPDCAMPRFMAYLDRVQPSHDQVAALRRMAGLLLADTAKYEVFFQLYGNGANGKTVFLDILKALVGAHNVCYVSLQGLVERFETWPLAECKINISGELPTDMGKAAFHQVEGIFKDAVSGKEIEVQKKHVNKIPSARCRARFVMAANSLPTFMDRSDAIWRRLRIVPFPIQIPESARDADLARKITEAEMPAILMWALDGLAEVIRDGRVPDCEAGAELKRTHRLNCDHEQEFLGERVVRGDENDRIKGADLYGSYRGWMLDNGYRPCGAGRFYEAVERAFPGVRYGSVRVASAVTKGFAGLRVAEHGELFEGGL